MKKRKSKVTPSLFGDIKEEFPKSQEQIDIIMGLKTKDIINVNSLSGTGKTTLLNMIAEEFLDFSILYIVFNKKNQIEAQEKFPTNTICKTLNGLAYGEIRKNTNINLNFDNIINYSAKEVSILYKISYGEAIATLRELNEYLISDKIDFPKSKTKAEKMFNDMMGNKIKITHDFYVKYFHLLLNKGAIKLSYDIGMLDESQDTNLVTLAIFKLIDLKKKVYVGDKNQRIYSFRGSRDIFGLTEGIEYQLTETFRSHRSIADTANIILSRFKGVNSLLVSNIIKKKKVKNEAFLSRTNSELIRQMNSFIKDDKKFKTIREPHLIFQLVFDVYYFVNNQKNKIKYNNYLREFKNIKELTSYSEEVDDRELISAIKIVLEYKNRIFDIKKVADNYFYSNKKFKRFLSTAHTSKGLEWDKVTILDDFNLLSNLVIKANKDNCKDFRENIDTFDVEIVDEINLYYIAITRAKYELKIKGIIKDELFLSEKELDKKIKDILDMKNKKDS